LQIKINFRIPNYPPSEDIYNKDTKRVTSILLISAKENPVEINNERELNEQKLRGRYVGDLIFQVQRR
jgi:hypothetical protein